MQQHMNLENYVEPKKPSTSARMPFIESTEVGKIRLYCEKSGQQSPTGCGEQGLVNREHGGLWAGDHAWFLDLVVLGTRVILADGGDSLSCVLIVFFCVNIVRDLGIFLKIQ